MIFAAIGDTPYDIVLWLHIATAFLAFTPSIGHLVATRLGGGESALSVRTVRTVYAPALILMGLLGFGVSGMSAPEGGDPIYAVSDTWVLIAVLLWVAMNGLLHAVVVPGLRDGGAEGARKVELGMAGINLALAVALYLMVFKPGA